MKITNGTALPAPLVAALRDDGYSRGDSDISATALIAPARKVALEETHAAELEEDAADLAAILIGKAVHAAIAARAGGEFSDRRRLYMTVAGWTVSGQTDHVEDGETLAVVGDKIVDYKTVGVGEWRFGLKEERAQQLNIYAELRRCNGYNVSALSACLIFKDWSAPQARHANADDYPPHSIVEVDVPLWPRAEAQAYILGRVLAHQAARRDLPPCSDEERWLRGEQWAVMKAGNTRATKNFGGEAEAAAFAAEKGGAYHVEPRPGVFNRCEYYCPVGRQGLCSQWNNERAE